jgi:hypothetical protein
VIICVGIRENSSSHTATNLNKKRTGGVTFVRNLGSEIFSASAVTSHLRHSILQLSSSSKMALAPSTIVITAECLCKAHSFSTEISINSLPLSASACHCDSCRHVTGALYSVDVPWPEPRQNVDTTKLKHYAFSANISILFCGICSSPIFFEFTKKSHDLGVFTGALKNHDVDLVKIVDHIFVGDTIDGGATMWLQKPNAGGRRVPRFKERSNTEQYSYDWPAPSTLIGYEKQTDEKYIPLRCHCKGVDFLLHRGSYEGKTEAELPWFIDPKTHKLLASFDVCDSCRLQSGIDILNWTFSELANISLSTEFPGEAKGFPRTTAGLKAAVDARDSAIGSLDYYLSSSDVQRYFCKVCSATVFYAVDERPEIVDVAVGLLESHDGARAESFLSWNLGGPFSWAEDAKGGWREDFMQRVRDEAEEWRIKRGYPKGWRRVKKEKETELS